MSDKRLVVVSREVPILVYEPNRFMIPPEEVRKKVDYAKSPGKYDPRLLPLEEVELPLPSMF